MGYSAIPKGNINRSSANLSNSAGTKKYAATRQLTSNRMRRVELRTTCTASYIRIAPVIFLDVDSAARESFVTLARPAKAGIFSGSQSHQGKSQSPVTWVAFVEETKRMKPTDKAIFRMVSESP